MVARLRFRSPRIDSSYRGTTFLNIANQDSATSLQWRTLTKLLRADSCLNAPLPFEPSNTAALLIRGRKLNVGVHQGSDLAETIQIEASVIRVVLTFKVTDDHRNVVATATPVCLVNQLI